MKSLEAGFALFGWQFEPIEERLALRALFSGRDTQYQVFAMRLIDEGLYRFVILCPIQVEPARRATVGELLHRINGQLPLGAFELDFESGGLRWVSAVDSGGEALPAPWIGHAIQRGLTSFESVWRELLATAEGRWSAEQAALRCQLAVDLSALNPSLSPSGARLELSGIDEGEPAFVRLLGGTVGAAEALLAPLYGTPLPFELRHVL